MAYGPGRLCKAGNDTLELWHLVTFATRALRLHANVEYPFGWPFGDPFGVRFRVETQGI